MSALVPCIGALIAARSLSNDEGTVKILWKLEENDQSGPTFAMDWIESGGPKTEKPSRSGFGSTVIDRILKASIEGEVSLDWRPSGLVCEISCPADKVVENARSSGQQSEDVIQLKKPQSETARRILVVEDEILIGIEIAEIFKEAGFEIFGPVATVGSALDLLDNQMCDAAVLDINLGQETSGPIAKHLSELGAPYLSVSGRSVEDRPTEFSGSPHITKPIQSALLVKELNHLLDASSQKTVSQAH